MSFSDFHRVIRKNDTVILYIGFNELFAIEVKSHIPNRHGSLVPHIFQTRYGSLDVKSLEGREFGSRVQLSKGWAVVLYPTPELWTVTLPHRTQILYSTDISMVIGRLNIGPGSVVCEAGTGSGSLSHAIIRAVGPMGHLHTADFHKERVQLARDEFSRHGLSSRVTVHERDVCSEGWLVEGAADAVFLDMPAPWLALHHAVNAIKESGGRICSFSPCVEQVSRTCTLMRRLGLQNVRTFEVIARELQVRRLDMPILTIGKDDGHLKNNTTDSDESPLHKKAKIDHADDTEQNDRTSNTPTEDRSQPVTNSSTSDILKSSSTDNNTNNKKPTASKSILTAVPVFKQAGHTGFLTFCMVPPAVPRPLSNVV